LCEHRPPVAFGTGLRLATNPFALERDLQRLFLAARADRGDEEPEREPDCESDEADEDSGLRPGQQVATMMGGMGRSYDGAYGQYVSVPAAQVIPFETSLPWDAVGALPEMFQTAYGSLTTGLDLKAGQTLLIRGGTSTVGLSAAATVMIVIGDPIWMHGDWRYAIYALVADLAMLTASALVIAR
jgi:hypothetical protein